MKETFIINPQDYDKPIYNLIQDKYIDQIILVIDGIQFEYVHGEKVFSLPLTTKVFKIDDDFSVMTPNKFMQKMKESSFTEKKLWFGSAYETFTTLIFNQEPKPYNRTKVIGSGFNYGSTNAIIVDEPCILLVLAEND